jgi:hypothetical protein
MPSEISTVSGDRPVKDLKRELAEAREQQAATAEILKVISSSPTDLHRVMATVAHNAAQVCGANDAQVYRINNGALHIVASCGAVGATASARIDGLPLTRGTVTGRAFLDRQSIHVPDLAAVLETEFPDSRSYQKELGFRTTLATPLLSKNIPIGVILIRRMAVNPFSNTGFAVFISCRPCCAVLSPAAKRFRNAVWHALTQRFGGAHLAACIILCPTRS